MKKIAKILLGVTTTCLLVYLHLLNTYMAYQSSGLLAAIATFVFVPISIIVWFFVVLINAGPLNLYCITWIVAMIMSFVCEVMRRKK